MQQKYLALTMVFQRTVTTPLRLCLTLGVHPTIAAPSPRAPYPGSDYASVNVLLRHQQKGDISNELTMGTFLTRLDTHLASRRRNHIRIVTSLLARRSNPKSAPASTLCKQPCRALVCNRESSQSNSHQFGIGLNTGQRFGFGHESLRPPAPDQLCARPLKRPVSFAIAVHPGIDLELFSGLYGWGGPCRSLELVGPSLFSCSAPPRIQLRSTNNAVLWHGQLRGARLAWTQPPFS